jgi:ferredoxin
LRVLWRLGDQPDGRFDEARLARLVPDFAARWTWLCGPPGLMARAARMWADAGAEDRLSRERFVAAVPTASPAGPAPALRVLLSPSGRSFAADPAATLLDQLERAGERPVHGCRIGICHTCKCRKRSGTVLNLRTGELSSQPDEEIQLCLSVPRSDLELDL